jgi:hypothetical protein
VPAPPPAEQPGSPEDLVRVLRTEGIGDRRVLAAFRAVPRARFVPPEAASKAYLDAPIRIAHGQVTTQPSQAGPCSPQPEVRSHRPDSQRADVAEPVNPPASDSHRRHR